ncbi:type II secretion system protein M [Pyxidicoccus parkwayensis]|uniref:Type II secretion system protein M n=1 Tax=Pyxidicoccus parkwayensis TaxID=2813578 RepID=A0ABX7NID7_9BACT|nr:type II secretion system protein GspM [Pyxidicoccus parkwaysis]QSQ18630.1 type II secretion system protein M [Pyxidicoccus parkwaysis]
MAKASEIFAPVTAWFERLSERERRMVSIAGAALMAFIVFAVVVGFSNSASGYRKRTQDKMAKLQEVQALASSYREAQAARQNVEQQLTSNNVQLISYIEDKATAAGLQVPNMTPKGDLGVGDGKIIESSVELTFTDVDLRKLTDFLRTVESGPGVVKVKYLRIEPRPASDTLTAWTTVATYRMKQ